MKTTSFLLATVFLAASLCACGGKTEANRKTGAQAQGKVLATVNDVPITEYDMKLISRRVGHGEQANPEPSPAMLDTLAAAYAEVGRFKDAVQTALAALELAKRVGQADQAQRIESRLELYRSGRPYHDQLRP